MIQFSFAPVRPRTTVRGAASAHRDYRLIGIRRKNLAARIDCVTFEPLYFGITPRGEVCNVMHTLYSYPCTLLYSILYIYIHVVDHQQQQQQGSNPFRFIKKKALRSERVFVYLYA